VDLKGRKRVVSDKSWGHTKALVAVMDGAEQSEAETGSKFFQNSLDRAMGACGGSPPVSPTSSGKRRSADFESPEEAARQLWEEVLNVHMILYSK